MKIFAPQFISLFVFISFFATLTDTMRADIESPSAYQLFGISASYNDVFFGDYYGRNGDIEGHAAIKGNVDVQSYGFGSGEQNLHSREVNSTPTLVVGGNVKASGTGVYDGDAYIQGTLTPQDGGSKWNTLSTKGTGPYNSVDPGYQGTAGTVYVKGTLDADLDYQYQKHTEASIPFDFTVAENQLRTVSSDLWSLENTLDALFEDRNIVIDMTGLSGLQVLTLDAADFMDMGTNRNILINNAGDDLTLVINVTNEQGLDYLWLRNEIVINGEAGPMYADFDGSNILLNTAIENVRIENVAFNASLLALDAEVYVTHGNIDGQVFAGSGYTEAGGEFHAYYTFDDKHFQQTVTPEPASILIFGVGMGALALSRRRRKAE